MNLLFWIFFGLLAGIIAKFLTPGRDPGGCIITMLLGVVGAFVGGAIYKFVTGAPFIAEFDLGSVAVAVGGAIVVLLIWRAVVGNRA